MKPSFYDNTGSYLKNSGFILYRGIFVVFKRVHFDICCTDVDSKFTCRIFFFKYWHQERSKNLYVEQS